MCKKVFFLAFFFSVAGLIGDALAATCVWDGGGTGNSWATVANWSNDTVPTSNDWVYFGDWSINSAGPGVVDSMGFCGTLILGNRTQGSPAYVNVDGSLIAAGNLYMGFGAGGDGTLTINSGDSTSAGAIVVGEAGTGTFIMNGGTLTSTWQLIIGNAGGSGHVQLNGGVFEPINNGVTITSGTMDIAGGLLKMKWDYTPSINTYVTAGLITAYGGRGTVSVLYDPITEYTLVSAEPLDLSVAWGAIPRDGGTLGGGYRDDPNARVIWFKGDTAASHDVYFGEDFDDVNNASVGTPLGVYIRRQADSGDANGNSYDPGTLELGRTYYWRIDEVESDGTTIYKGETWQFEVSTSIVIDVFDSYADTDDMLVKWTGTGTNSVELETASAIGPGAMKVVFNNDSSVSRDVPLADLTQTGVETLTFFFHGVETNTANASQLYVKLEDSAIGATVTYDGDANDLVQDSWENWNMWNIALSDFSGVNLTDVAKITIGITGTSSDTVYFDDIRLHPPSLVDTNLLPITVENGVFVYPDGREVSLFGTGYYPMSWQQYVNMASRGADFRQAIKKDVSDMKACGVQIVRAHVFESEICDANGNLVENLHLDIFDMLVDELNRQGIYLFLTVLTWWDSPNALPDAYTRHLSKMGMMYVEEALVASENFIDQFLRHPNPYTCRLLKDEPSLAVFEIINEPWYWPYEALINPDYDIYWRGWQTDPADLVRDLDLWKQLFQASGMTYNDFQKSKMSIFLQRMISAIRQTGATQPIASALFDSAGQSGIRAAIGESAVDAVTDGWYPGGFSTLHEYVNQMPAEARAYQLAQEVRHKAKMVYEFDICQTYNNVIMYPAMARRWRSMGAQIACQFQYDSSVTAEYNTDWDVHYFNYEVTPAKAVAFEVASESFASIPRGTVYPTPSDNEIFYGTAVSFQHQQVLRVTEDEVYHAHEIGSWIPFELPSSPKKIMGRGNSPYAEYSGSGLYKLERSLPNRIILSTTMNTIFHKNIEDFFSNVGFGLPNITLSNSPEQFKLKLNGWDSFRCFDENNGEVLVSNGTFEVVPGKTYTLCRELGLGDMTILAGNWLEQRGDPIIWYKFDETSGTTVVDSSGNGYDAVASESGHWDSFGFDGNGCIDFDGTFTV